MNTVFQSNTPFLKNIKKVLLFCVTIIIGAIVIEFFLIESLLVKREKDASVINTAGRQRTLSQKITKNLYAYHHNASLEKELSDDAEDWRQAHASLQERDDNIIGKDKVQSNIDSLFAAINPYQQKLYNTAISMDSLSRTGELENSIKKWEEGFLLGMDELVNLYQQQSEKAIFRLQLIVSLFSVFFILLVLIMYFFLIDPIILSMRALALEQKAQNQNIASILENTEDLIWSVDLNLNLLIFNSTFKQCMEEEYGVEPKLRQSILEFSQDSPEKDKVLYHRALQGETFRIDGKLDVNGMVTYHELSFNPIWAEDGTISGCNVSRRDETERIETLNEVKRSRKIQRTHKELPDWVIGGGKLIRTNPNGPMNYLGF